jgi:hypothetical protein
MLIGDTQRNIRRGFFITISPAKTQQAHYKIHKKQSGEKRPETNGGCQELDY